MGLIGVLFVELFQYWQIVDNAWIEFLKLLGFTVFLLAVGTLPYIDNMAHIGTCYNRPRYSHETHTGMLFVHGHFMF